MSQFKKQLSAHYVGTPLRRFRSASVEQLERYAWFYQKAFALFLPADLRARILEVGCGMGHFHYFLKQQGYEITWALIKETSR